MICEEVAGIVDRALPAGSHARTFDAVALSSGLYVYRMQAGDFTAVRKMSLIR